MKKNIIKSLIFTLCIFIFGIGTAFAVKTINSTYSLGNIASFMDVQYYEVDFDTNGGSGVFSKQRIKSGLKAPLNMLLGEPFGRAFRYFLIVIVSGIIWPMSFKWFAKLGNKE